MSRIPVAKTYKLYIGGAFVRSESGRTMISKGQTVCQGSRKDVRDAVVAGRGAFSGWSGRTAYNRGQILYRMAEMLESRRGEFAGLTSSDAEVGAAIDRLVYYAGWTDKFTAVLGSVNPIADRFFGFTFPEPMGVVGIVADQTPLLGIVSQIAPVIASGNVAVILASEAAPVAACVFSEILDTSDLPGGVVNLITGEHAELIPVLAKHQDVNAINYRNGDTDIEAMIRKEGAENMKRIQISHPRSIDEWQEAASQGISEIESFVEYKSVWHPIGV